MRDRALHLAHIADGLSDKARKALRVGVLSVSD